MSFKSGKSVSNVYQNTRILEEYRDRCYVNNVLCQFSSDYYGKLKMVLSIPLIILSSVMTILNSSELNSASSTDSMRKGTQILNIILNTFTIILISLGNTLKYNEKESNFRVLAIKYNKLCHIFEDNLVYSASKISHGTIFELITEYDNLNETLEYSFPEHIKNKVKKIYKGNRTLPNILNCETDFIRSIENIGVNDDIIDKYKNVAYATQDAQATQATRDINSDDVLLKTQQHRFSRENSADKQFKRALNFINGGSNGSNRVDGSYIKKKTQQYYNDTDVSPKINYNTTRRISSPYLSKCESPFVKHYRKRKTSITMEELYNTEDGEIKVNKKPEPIRYTEDSSDNENRRGILSKTPSDKSNNNDDSSDNDSKHVSINISETPTNKSIINNTILNKYNSIDIDNNLSSNFINTI